MSDRHRLVVHTPRRIIAASTGCFPVRVVRTPISPGWIVGLGVAVVRVNRRRRYPDVGPAADWRIHVDRQPMRVMPLYWSRAELRATREHAAAQSRAAREAREASLAAHAKKIAALTRPPDDPEGDG